MKHYFGSNTIVDITSHQKSISTLIQKTVDNHQIEEDAFFIGDLGDIIKKQKLWQECLPRVEPFYAVKCNDHYAVLKLLADMGLSFDCASKAEIQKVLKLGVDPSRIVYANPCKQTSFIKYAAKNDVSLMTFDNEDELVKIKAVYPGARLVLRILPPSNFKVQCDLGIKFGCFPGKAYHLLEAARKLDLNVVGVSFHVGSGCQEAEAYDAAIQQARDVFDMGLSMGFDMDLLDIGGGFPGHECEGVSFEEIAEVVNVALDKYFPGDDVKFIAEPGRFYVASAFTISTNIIAKRIVARDQRGKNAEPVDFPTADEEPAMMYYVNDGVYGSFNCLLYDHAAVVPSLLKNYDEDMLYTSSIWGPTCDGLDCIMPECKLPELRSGDWIYFRDMGAYTLASASTFNGMPAPTQYFVCQMDLWEEVYPNAEMDEKPVEKIIPVMKSGHYPFETLKFNPNVLPEGITVGDYDVDM
ncbi:ornithine decarboxylase-like [Mytilus trossulus]|uniref:ornithine decarboxylase-like n=1 Tax=Mytilus trossulus TaxID=6551 RepID=UPI003004F066